MSGIISKRRLSRMLVMGAALTALSACSQMTKHSNMLVFGANTSVGVKVGQDASQAPTVSVGYQRQEVAFVPVLANTGVGTNGELSPCPATTGAKVAPEGCKFEASMDGTDKDSYSVLASFGTEAGGGGGNASIKVAQYFATGIAAQQLAESGGANVVMAGGDTGKIADAAKAAAEARKTELELRIQKEKDNAAKQVEAIDTAVIVAKSILGKSTDAVKSANLKTLAGKFVGLKCGQTELDKLDKRTVEKFLTELRAQKRNCLRVWGNKLKQ